MEIKTNSDRILMSDALRGSVAGLDNAGGIDDIVDMHPSVVLRFDDDRAVIGMFVGAGRSKDERTVRLRVNLVEALELMTVNAPVLVDATIDLGPTSVKFEPAADAEVDLSLADVDAVAALCTLTATFVSSQHTRTTI